MKKICLFFAILSISLLLNSQYVGIYSLAEDEKIQSFYIDYNGNISLGNIINVGVFPDRMAISSNGLVIILNTGYYPPNYLTISVIKIYSNGNVIKVRDVDLGGRGYEVNISEDDKYAFVTHEVLFEEDQFDVGVSVLKLSENDVILPSVQYLSLEYDLGIGFGWSAFSNKNIFIGVYTTTAYIFDFDENNFLTYTNNSLNIGHGAKPDAEFTPDGKRCLISSLDHDLWVLDVDEQNNVSIWGTVETELEGPRDIAITPNSRLVLQVMTSYPDGVAVYRNNEDRTIDFKSEITGILNPWVMAMTPDGKYATVIYNPSSIQSYMTILKINGDETVERLPDKDVVIGPIANAVVLYKLPETSVNEIWDMYK